MKKNDYLKMLLAGLTGMAGADAMSADAKLQAELEKLANSAPPTNLAPGAMCYKVSFADRDTQPVAYICPKCREKTLYKRDPNVWQGIDNMVESTLPRYRQQMKLLEALGPVTLDETEFCEHCSGKKIAAPKPYIVVKHSDGTIHRAEIQKLDIARLLAFFEKKDRIDYGPGGERALKDEVGSLSGLLGVPVFADTIKEKQRVWYEKRVAELRSNASKERMETWDWKQKKGETSDAFRKRRDDAQKTIDEKLEADLKQAEIERDSRDFTRIDPVLESRLDALAQSPDPTKLAPTATCYKQVLRDPQTKPAEYICPTCHQKALFERDTRPNRMRSSAAYFIEACVPAYRRKMTQLEKIKAPVILDESGCCYYCSGSDFAKVQKPKAYLVVTRADYSTHRVELKSEEDIAMLAAFYEGKDRFQNRGRGETALKKVLPRLRELLGLPAEKNAQK